MKILGIGETVIDNVYRVEKLEESLINADSDQKTDAILKDIHSKNIHPEVHLGGPVPAALVVLSRLGIDCSLVSSVGRDDNAKIIRKTLKREQIRFFHKLQKKSKVNSVLVDKKSGIRKKIRGITIHPDIKNLERKFVRMFDIIIIDRHEKTAFFEILQKKRRDTKIVIDPSVEISDFTLQMIRLADYPIIPIEALARINESSLIDSLKKLYLIAKKNLIITAGDKGSFIYNGKEIELIPAFDIDAIDVTGAGDVYRGAFAYGIVNNWDIKKCATFGNFVSGLQCTKPGNISAIPEKSQMDVFKIIYNKKSLNMPTINKTFNSYIRL